MPVPFALAGENEPLEAPGGPLEAPEPPGSMLAELRAAGDRQRAERSTVVPIGGALKQLAVRYRPLTIAESERYAELQTSAGRGMTNMGLAIDMMVACCTAVIFTPTGGHPTELADEAGLVRLSNRLAVLMGWPEAPDGEYTPREVVERLFGGQGMLLDEHVGTLVQWMREPEEGAPGEG
jgi:hypothetical protein